MTTQPWTPERALAMFKDWDDPDLTMHEFCEKWYVAYNPDDFARIAIEALASATAEIERQRARADAAEKETDRRIAMFDEMMAGEQAENRRLKAELAKAQQDYERCVRGQNQLHERVDLLHKAQQQPEPVFIEVQPDPNGDHVPLKVLVNEMRYELHCLDADGDVNGGVMRLLTKLVDYAERSL